MPPAETGTSSVARPPVLSLTASVRPLGSMSAMRIGRLPAASATTDTEYVPGGASTVDELLVAPGPPPGVPGDVAFSRQKPSRYTAPLRFRSSKVWLPEERPPYDALAPGVGLFVEPVVPAKLITPFDTPSMKTSALPPFGLVA